MDHQTESEAEIGSLIVEDLTPVDGWNAWHIFLYDFAEQDDFLCEVVAPLVESLKSQTSDDLTWFFIRYWEEGSHLRLRFRDLDRGLFEEIGEMLFAGVKRFAQTPSSVSDWPSTTNLTAHHGQAEQKALRPMGTVSEIAYDPEERRYGGAHCIRGCEIAFRQSSSIALQHLANNRESGHSRRGVGLLMTAIGAAIATENDEQFVAFLSETRVAWARYLGDLVSADSTGVSQSSRSQDIAQKVLDIAFAARRGIYPNESVVAQWLGLLTAEKARIQTLHAEGLLVCPVTGRRTSTSTDCGRAIASIFSSYNHMMMNRLGITPHLEYEFAALLEDAMQRRAQG